MFTDYVNVDKERVVCLYSSLTFPYIRLFSRVPVWRLVAAARLGRRNVYSVRFIVVNVTNVVVREFQLPLL